MKEKLLQFKAEILKAIAQPTRLKILELLREKELCICEIAPLINGGQSNVSKHLSVLEKSKLVASRKEGVRVYVKANPSVFPILDSLAEILRKRIEEEKKEIEELERRI